jgi:uncharacterized protein (DUF924 family)
MAHNRPATPPDGWSDAVLRFWFEETTPKQWFEKDDAFDAALRRRFLELHEAVAAQPDDALLSDARTALAAIVVLDQMPRNMFRGSPRVYATDARALAVADQMIARRYDAGLSKDERLFCYLPFEHAEDRTAQARGVALVASLGDPDLTKWAEAHKAVIDRFGRFPHRNAILGRTSTPEEIEFLKQPGSSF